MQVSHNEHKRETGKADAAVADPGGPGKCIHQFWVERLCCKPMPLNKPAAVQVKRSPKPIQGTAADRWRWRFVPEGGRHSPLGASVVSARCSGVGTVLRACCSLGYPLGIPWVSLGYPLGSSWVERPVLPNGGSLTEGRLACAPSPSLFSLRSARLCRPLARAQTRPARGSHSGPRLSPG